MSRNNMEKGEVIMDAYAVKPKLPFVAKTDLKRTPATEENRKMIEFMDSHDFSFSYDRETKELKSHVAPKK